MFFDRKIKYLDYVENGERVRGAGFVKAEVRDRECRMLICVKGLHITDHFEKQVILLGDKQESFLCKIKIDGGRGTTGELRLDSGRLGRGEIPYEGLKEIRIPIAAGKEIRCLWQEEQGNKRNNKPSREDSRERELQVIDLRPEKRKQEGFEGQSKSCESKEDQGEHSVQEWEAPEGEKGSRRAEKTGGEYGAWEPGESEGARRVPEAEKPEGEHEAWEPGKWEGERMISEAEKPEGEGRIREPEALQGEQREDRFEKRNQDADISKTNPGDGIRNTGEENRRGEGTELPPGHGSVKKDASELQGQEQRESESVRLFPLEDKWKQLSSIYPHIAPFEDEREYLSLGPEDFVIFPSNFYRVVNNSFLLHGYHNYRHLILARVESRGEVRYYVGVPGNFYDKEKQVALMFGFESFECKQEPARSGDYGYYMMRVEL